MKLPKMSADNFNVRTARRGVYHGAMRRIPDGIEASILNFLKSFAPLLNKLGKPIDTYKTANELLRYIADRDSSDLTEYERDQIESLKKKLSQQQGRELEQTLAEFFPGVVRHQKDYGRFRFDLRNIGSHGTNTFYEVKDGQSDLSQNPQWRRQLQFMKENPDNALVYLTSRKPSQPMLDEAKKLGGRVRIYHVPQDWYLPEGEAFLDMGLFGALPDLNPEDLLNALDIKHSVKSF